MVSVFSTCCLGLRADHRIFITVVRNHCCFFVMMPVFLMVVCRPTGRVSGVDMYVLL